MGHELAYLQNAVVHLKPKLASGGMQAKSALIRLIQLISAPSAKAVFTAHGIPAAAAKLLKRESSDSRLKRLAASVITILTGMPVAAENADSRTGSGGKVLIMMPRPSRVHKSDKALIELKAGMV